MHPMKTALRILAFAIVALPLAVLVAGQAGLLRGRVPTDLGARDGRLKPPSHTENSVSSQAGAYPGAGAVYARIAPIAYTGDGAAALARIAAIVRDMPGARILRSEPDYLHVQFETRWLKFVDDAEFLVAPADAVIHLRSASRIGQRDLGVNRARMEHIRGAFQRQPR
jgi:uncharacterized protein (DUF1499 family)